jgi:hypothetical protein
MYPIRLFRMHSEEKILQRETEIEDSTMLKNSVLK